MQITGCTRLYVFLVRFEDIFHARNKLGVAFGRNAPVLDIAVVHPVFLASGESFRGGPLGRFAIPPLYRQAIAAASSYNPRAVFPDAFR